MRHEPWQLFNEPALSVYTVNGKLHSGFPAPQRTPAIAFPCSEDTEEKGQKGIYKRWHKRKRSWRSAAQRWWAMIEQLLWNWIERVGWQMSQRLPLVSDQRVNKKDKLCSRQLWKWQKREGTFLSVPRKRKTVIFLNNVVVYIYDPIIGQAAHVLKSQILISAFNIFPHWLWK